MHVRPSIACVCEGPYQPDGFVHQVSLLVKQTVKFGTHQVIRRSTSLTHGVGYARPVAMMCIWTAWARTIRLIAISSGRNALASAQTRCKMQAIASMLMAPSRHALLSAFTRFGAVRPPMKTFLKGFRYSAKHATKAASNGSLLKARRL